MLITTSGSGESQREAHRDRKILVLQSIYLQRGVWGMHIHFGAPGAGFLSM